MLRDIASDFNRLNAALNNLAHGDWRDIVRWLAGRDGKSKGDLLEDGLLGKGSEELKGVDG